MAFPPLEMPSERLETAFPPLEMPRERLETPSDTLKMTKNQGFSPFSMILAIFKPFPVS